MARKITREKPICELQTLIVRFSQHELMQIRAKAALENLTVPIFVEKNFKKAFLEDANAKKQEYQN